MNRINLAVVASLALVTSLAFALDAPVADPVPAGATVQKVAGGFRFTEGPAWDGESSVYFSDIPNNRIMKFDTATGETGVAIEPSHQSNGLMFDTQGRLIMCRHAARDVARLEPDGKTTPIAERFEGKRLNSPNDLDIAADGRIYFTDPRYANEDDREIDVYGVYTIGPAGELKQIITDLKKPNGIHLSPDEKTLYVVDNGAATVWAYDVQADGGVANGRLFADMSKGPGAGGGDGMTIDRAGRLYVTGRSDVWVFDHAGVLVTKIPVPEGPANCAFGGQKLDVLYITARTSLYRIQLNATGEAR